LLLLLVQELLGLWLHQQKPEQPILQRPPRTQKPNLKKPQMNQKKQD
jgi:hypothetical protein